jgi:hypothetical protein
LFLEINQAFFNEKYKHAIDIECRIKKYNDKGGYSIRMDKADFVKNNFFRRLFEII